MEGTNIIDFAVYQQNKEIEQYISTGKWSELLDQAWEINHEFLCDFLALPENSKEKVGPNMKRKWKLVAAFNNLSYLAKRRVVRFALQQINAERLYKIG
ncbi:MAG: hypothetical protein ACK5JU_11000 [Bacteroidales bacterium]